MSNSLLELMFIIVNLAVLVIVVIGAVNIMLYTSTAEGRWKKLVIARKEWHICIALDICECILLGCSILLKDNSSIIEFMLGVSLMIIATVLSYYESKQQFKNELISLCTPIKIKEIEEIKE